MNQFLESSDYIDWKSPAVLAQAMELAGDSRSDEEIARSCFQFVRDHIKHSGDHQLNPVTLKASDVLAYSTGYCYAKSHLLAALLRANGIPAALCYQRLAFEEDPSHYCLHGLNAIYLKAFGWYRVDPRGNKEGVNAEFDPPHEKLAFKTKGVGERDLKQRFSRPIAEVVEVLISFRDFREVAENLPDMRTP